ncbi:MAG: redoxin domain-containing protein [Janthinobacterium lividum]
MNKLWLLLPLALATTPALAQSCVLVGNVTGLGNKPVVFKYKSHGVDYVDTVRALQDHFRYRAKPSDDGRVTLHIVRSPYTDFWVEPGKLTVTGNIAQPEKLTITGTPENNVTNEYNRTIEWKYAVMAAKTPTAHTATNSQHGQATIQFIKQHPAARTSAHLLYWQTLMHAEKPLAEYKQLFGQLSLAVRQSAQGQQVAKRLQMLQDQPAVGRAVAGFTMADTAGTKHSLATYKGHYVLLDFWGHWCVPCLRAIPEVKALHTQYAQKLTIIGIAMEDASDAAIWKQTIRKHQIPGLQLSELQQADGLVIAGYNVIEFPTYLLLDPTGVLVMRTNDVSNITRKLATLSGL